MEQVFDDRYIERKNVTSRVLLRDECTSVENPWEQESSLAQSCSVKDLVIYAFTLGACATAFDAYFHSHNKVSEDSPSNFEVGLRKLRKIQEDEQLNALPMRDFVTVDEVSFIEGNLWMLWVLEKCTDSSTAYLGFEVDYFNLDRSGGLMSDDSARSLRVNSSELKDLVKADYTLAIRTAARLGEPWALRTIFPPKLEDEPGFWKLLLEEDPALYHRYLASDRWRDFKSVQEKTVHAFLAFELFKVRHQKPLVAYRHGKTYLPTEKFADYVRYDGINFASIYKHYSTRQLNNFSSVEDVIAATPEKRSFSDQEDEHKGRLLNSPPGAIRAVID